MSALTVLRIQSKPLQPRLLMGSPVAGAAATLMPTGGAEEQVAQEDIGDDVADNVDSILEEALENLSEATSASAGHTEQDACRRYARPAQFPGPLGSGEHNPWPVGDPAQREFITRKQLPSNIKNNSTLGEGARPDKRCYSTITEIGFV